VQGFQGRKILPAREFCSVFTLARPTFANIGGHHARSRKKGPESPAPASLDYTQVI
tara:strand:- start:500 stop:667 length:168 start_codon:yes stop_codon:yes gene_type:complete